MNNAIAPQLMCSEHEPCMCPWISPLTGPHCLLHLLLESQIFSIMPENCPTLTEVQLLCYQTNKEPVKANRAGPKPQDLQIETNNISDERCGATLVSSQAAQVSAARRGAVSRFQETSATLLWKSPWLVFGFVVCSFHHHTTLDDT